MCSLDGVRLMRRVTRYHSSLSFAPLIVSFRSVPPKRISGAWSLIRHPFRFQPEMPQRQIDFDHFEGSARVIAVTGGRRNHANLCRLMLAKGLFRGAKNLRHPWKPRGSLVGFHGVTPVSG